MKVRYGLLMALAAAVLVTLDVPAATWPGFERGMGIGKSVITWPLPEGVDVSKDYEITVNGVGIPVALTPVPENRIVEGLRHPYSFAQFDADGEVEVVVKGFGKEAVIREQPPFRKVLEPNGRHRALVISANRPETDVPKDGDAGVVFIGPGLHRRDFTELKSGDTLYLAGGAWLEGSVNAKGTNITIRGRGVISGRPWEWQKGPSQPDSGKKAGWMVSLSGSDLTVKDITIWSSWGWCLVFNKARDVLVDNIRILNGRVINDDGIDVCRSRDVVIRNSFIRAQDDCIALKWHCENLVVSNCVLWTDVASAVRIGYECEKPPAVMRNFLFKDIDVPHLTLEPREPQAYWCNVGILIQASNDQVFENFRFEDIRFNNAEGTDVFLAIKTMPITQGFSFPHAGTVKGMTFRNISMPKTRNGMQVWLEARDLEHPIEGVVFENVTGYGRVSINGPVSGLKGVK